MAGRSRLTVLFVFAVLAVFALALAACGDDDDGTDATATTPAGETPAGQDPTETPDANNTPFPDTEDRSSATGSITVYSGRAEALIGPLVERFQEDTGIRVNIRYADTPELAATILEEGRNSPADVYIAQDAGSLGLLSKEGVLSELPSDILERVAESYRADNGEWVGLSGRARVVVYNTAAIDPDELPDSILDYTDPQWSGKIGWAPTNGSFQSFVTALRVTEGEDVARQWLEGIKANNPRVYPNNTAIVEAAASGEIEVGFVNHYYLIRFLAERGESFGARNFYFRDGDLGGLMNVAGAGILETAKNRLAAERFIEYMLEQPAQEYFATETFEFPLVPNVQVSFEVPPLSDLRPVAIDLTNLDDLRGTIELLQSTGVLP